MRIRIRIQLFTSMKILILLLKVMRICDHWPTDPPDLHFESPRLHFERPGPPGLYFQPRNLMNSDLNTDPDPASKNNADPRRSGYETLNLTCPGFINLATSKDTPKKKKNSNYLFPWQFSDAVSPARHHFRPPRLSRLSQHLRGCHSQS